VRITELSTVVLRLPEVRDVGDGTQDVLVVLVHTDEGLTGIGEVHTSPTVGEAIVHAPLSHVRSRGLAEALTGRDPLDVESCWQRMYEATEVYGRRGVAIHAISGVDLALWDLRGKAEGRAVAELLGDGRQRSTLETYASVLMPDTVDEARELAAACRDAGFRAVKYGWGGLGGGLEQATLLVGAVREEAPEGELMIDVGAGLELDEALRLADALEPFALRFLEEPLHPDDLEGFARLAQESPIPIATGEKETSLAGFRTLLDHGRPDIVQPDLARAGGFTEVERIWEAAQRRSTELIPHCWSTDILVSATAQFLASRPEPIPLEFCLEGNDLRRELASDPIRAREGVIEVPQGPGLGIELNHDTVRRFAVNSSRPLDDLLAAVTP
jgi:L-rhamnonate dehydratase